MLDQGEILSWSLQEVKGLSEMGCLCKQGIKKMRLIL